MINKVGENIKILHISTNDCIGGAAIAARCLHQAMLNLGIESKMLLLHKNSDSYGVSFWHPEITLSKTLKDIINYWNEKLTTTGIA